MSKYSENIPPEIENNIGWFLKDIKEGSTVLDVGCSTGYYGAYIKKNKKALVFGIEPSDDKIEAAKVLDGVYSFDLDGEWPTTIKERSYDAIFLGDVIEHLKRPEDTLIKLKALLKPKGKMFISTPNIAHLSIRLELMGGNFEYESMGILDSTHLKYFTRKSLERLVSESGFEIERMDSSESDFPKEVTQDILEKYGLKAGKKFWKIANSPEARAFQYKLVLIKANKTARPSSNKASLPVKPLQYKNDFINNQIKQTDAYMANAEKLKLHLSKVISQIDKVSGYKIFKLIFLMPSMKKLKKLSNEAKL